MTGTIGIVAFAVAIILAILIHEAGHFGFAKWFGIKVEEFFVGFGPRLWSTRRGETEYGVKAIPLGGYVRIAGMNPFQKTDPEELPRTYGAKPRWQRAAVIVAGPATHFVVAFVLFAIWLGLVGIPSERAVGVGAVSPRIQGEVSPAVEAGIEPGDDIVAVDGREVRNLSSLGDYIAEHVGEPITLEILRGDRRLEITLVPVVDVIDGEEVPRIGVVLQQGRILAVERRGFVGSITGGADLVWQSVLQTARIVPRVFGPEGLGRIGELVFGEAERRIDDPASIVGIARVAGQVGESFGLGNLLSLFAGINVFIGLLNLLPLPPFDGGHLAVLVVEKATGRAVDPRKLIPISAAVLSFFILFTFAVLYLDVVKPIDITP